ncbi:metallophosphoesterase [Fusibacter bizertensis]|uniref:Metallophosphoesterase n=1 Tax=Fusibacter bizertensis TaxID=1488331 RepID=A0ABT6NH70_9FIRM|nr:metallophosphoesterase [Fusibacter bizertensis]MDH8679776.1 metallophosphoesterase [Fusibacter bizertensis]
MKRKMMILIIIIMVILSAFAFDFRLKVVNYELKSNKIETSIRIALITDLHSCKYGENEVELIQAIDVEKPDIILFGGDIFDDVISHENSIYLLEGIANKYPCYYVTGNHEVWSSEVNEIKTIVKSFGVTVLEGTSEMIQINNSKIQISGVDDSSIFKLKADGSSVITELEAIKGNIDQSVYQLLLYHRPQNAQQYLSYGFDLMLSGHAHGGQWRIPFLLNGLLAPDQGFFPKYAGGLYNFETSKLIISRGLARESTRIPRIFNRPELVIIDISK